MRKEVRLNKYFETIVSLLLVGIRIRSKIDGVPNAFFIMKDSPKKLFQGSHRFLCRSTRMMR